MPADLDELVALMPFARQLGVVVDEASADRVVARLAWTPELCTSAGIMHGGALMSLADPAGAPNDGHDHLDELVVPAGDGRDGARGSRPGPPGPDHGHRADQPVRLQR